MANWTALDMPDLTGRTTVVTGASSGIGEEAALAFAAKGAQVVLAVRDAAKGEATRSRIARRYPQAKVDVSLVDMADLASIRAFAERSLAALPHVDILLNNAGLGMQPKRTVTVDGYERQFATNHLGHYALTGLLLPALLKAPAPRVVTVASIAHRRGRIAFDDLQGETGYNGSRAYSQSKLANILFSNELDRRARAANSRLVSVAAHPGMSATGFFQAAEMPAVVTAVAGVGVRLVGQDSAAGALPGLYAATMPDVKGGDYWGPDGILEIRGRPAPAAVARQARDPDAAERLWRVSEELTGVHYPPLA